MVLTLLMDLGRDRPPSAATREAEDKDAKGSMPTKPSVGTVCPQPSKLQAYHKAE